MLQVIRLVMVSSLIYKEGVPLLIGRSAQHGKLSVQHNISERKQTVRVPRLSATTQELRGDRR